MVDVHHDFHVLLCLRCLMEWIVGPLHALQILKFLEITKDAKQPPNSAFLHSAPAKSQPGRSSTPHGWRQPAV